MTILTYLWVWMVKGPICCMVQRQHNFLKGAAGTQSCWENLRYKSIHISSSKFFVYFAQKNLLFLFYISTFTKHPRQFIYSTHLFNKIFIIDSIPNHHQRSIPNHHQRSIPSLHHQPTHQNPKTTNQNHQNPWIKIIKTH